jgi:CelD/BcsL family acetyltransferase involved in cellulose biosynthesis
MSRGELVTDVAGAEQLAPEWDALAVAAGLPMSTPAWMLAWWRRCAPPNAELRVIAVRDGGELVGVVPFWVGEDAVYRLLGAELSPATSPVALAGRVWETAGVAARVLVGSEPSPAAVLLAPTPLESFWVSALREQWPGRARPVSLLSRLEQAASIYLDDGSVDGYLAKASTNMRRSVRRRQRMFENEGGSYRMCSPETMETDIDTFVRLHTSYWEGSNASYLVALGDRLVPLLRDVGRDLGAGDRFRMWMLEVDGVPISADLAFATGASVVTMNGGWDVQYKRMSPPRLSLIRLLEQCYEQGERRVELGWGRLDYKRAYTAACEPIAWTALFPISRKMPPALANFVPAVVERRVRQTAKRALPATSIERVRELERRIRQGR